MAFAKLAVLTLLALRCVSALPRPSGDDIGVKFFTKFPGEHLTRAGDIFFVNGGSATVNVTITNNRATPINVNSIGGALTTLAPGGDEDPKAPRTLYSKYYARLLDPGQSTTVVYPFKIPRREDYVSEFPYDVGLRFSAPIFTSDGKTPIVDFYHQIVEIREDK